MTRMKKKDLAILEAFFSLSLVLLLFLRYNPCFPFAYKRGSRMPHEGGILIQEHDTSTRLSDKRALSTHSFLPPETWDPFPLSPVCNPYYKPSAGTTSSSKLDVGTFCPKQYKPLCPPSTPSEPNAQIQIYSSVVRKHRHPESGTPNADELVSDNHGGGRKQWAHGSWGQALFVS